MFTNLAIFLAFTSYDRVSLPQYRFSVRNQHQLLMRKTSKWHSLSEVESSRTYFEVLGLEGQVLENWPVLGSRTALFFELLKFCGALENFFGRLFFVEIAWKIFEKTFFFGEHLHLCPWSLASSIPVLGLERVCPWPWPRIFLCPWPWPRALCPRLHLCSLLF